MSRQLEEELERVMRAAGESAPRPDPDLVGRIDERGRLRRRTRLRTAVVCGTAVVAVGVAGVAADIIRPRTLEPAGGNILETKPEKPEKPVRKESPPGPAAPSIPLAKNVWPNAVHEIPQKLPDGRQIFPQTFLDADTILVTTQSSFEKSDALYKYDLKTHAVEEIAEVDSPGYANDFTVENGWVVWWANVESTKDRGTEIWGVPLAGGKARKLVLAPAGGIDFLAVSDGEVHWSYDGTAKPVYSAPLSGDGEGTPIPESKGYHIVSWPWIGSPGEEFRNGPIAEEIRYRTLRNVETGETRTTTDLKGIWSCHLSWCVGTTNDKGYAQRRDGSDRKRLEGIGMFFPTTTPMPAQDRFYVGETVVVDTHTGKTGRLQTSGDGFRIPVDDRLYYSNIKDGYELIDLAAIE